MSFVFPTPVIAVWCHWRTTSSEDAMWSPLSSCLSVSSATPLSLSVWSVMLCPSLRHPCPVLPVFLKEDLLLSYPWAIQDESLAHTQSLTVHLYQYVQLDSFLCSLSKWPMTPVEGMLHLLWSQNRTTLINCAKTLLIIQQHKLKSAYDLQGGLQTKDQMPKDLAKKANV